MTDLLLNDLFAREGLVLPGILPWPLSGRAEEDRLGREAAFASGLGANPPPGLEWIRSHGPSKYRPDRVLEGCRSVLVTALGYYREDGIDRIPAKGPGGSTESPSPSPGRIARYARGRDYHRELGKRLKRIVRNLQTSLPGEGFRYFTDIGPLDETWLVQASGLGFKGRHTLAILPKQGSWVVLGHILSTHPFQPSVPSDPSIARCPEGCTRCIDACPTGALSFPGRLDASRCISYRTIEHKGPLGSPSNSLTSQLRDNTGDRIFGCDICQEVCPFNAVVKETTVEAFRRDIAGASRSLRELLQLKDRQAVLERFAGSPLMRAGRDTLVRNACIAAGNSRDISLIRELGVLRDNEEADEAVRREAALALRKLSPEADGPLQRS